MSQSTCFGSYAQEHQVTGACDHCVDHCVDHGACLGVAEAARYVNNGIVSDAKTLFSPGHVFRHSGSAGERQVGGSHYKNMSIQPWAVIDTWPLEQRIGFYRGSALSYLMRMGTKDASLQEIKKGAHYLEKLIEVLEEKSNDQ